MDPDKSLYNKKNTSELISNLFKQENKRFNRLKTSFNVIDIDKDIRNLHFEQYLHSVSKTGEFLLHFLPALFTTIICEIEANTYSSRLPHPFLINFFDLHLNSQNKRNFLSSILNEIQRLADFLPRIATLSNVLHSDLNFLLKFRNYQAHAPLNVHLKSLKHRLSNFSSIQNVDSIEELVNVIHLKIENITTTLVEFLVESNINVLNQENFSLELSDNKTIKQHRYGLLCLDTLKNLLFSYNTTHIKFIPEKTGHIEYTNMEDSIFTEDLLYFHEHVEAYIEAEKHKEICDPSYKLFLKDEKILFPLTIHKAPLGSFALRTKFRDVQSEKDFEKTVLLPEGNKIIHFFDLHRTFEITNVPPGEYLFSFEITRNNRLLFKRKTRIIVEELNRGTTNILVNFPHSTHQNEKFPITLSLSNTGNISKIISIIIDKYAKKHFKIPSQDEIVLEPYQTKHIRILIKSIRSENLSYPLGELNVMETIEGKTKIVMKKELGNVFIEKSYSPQNFYDRKAILDELKPNFDENKGIFTNGIRTYWIQGEAGQGKTRLANEISEIISLKNQWCVTATILKRDQGNPSLLSSTAEEFNTKENDIENTFGLLSIDKAKNKKELVRNWLSLIRKHRKNPKTPKKIIIQIDDLHYMDKDLLDELLKAIHKEDEIYRKESSIHGIKPKNSEIIIIFYTRTPKGLGSYITGDENYNQNLKQVYQLLSKKIPSLNQYLLPKISVEDIKLGNISTEVEMVEDILLEIYYPHDFQEEEKKTLRNILNRKSQGNPFILGLLLEKINKKNLVTWDQAKQCWTISSKLVENEIEKIFPEQERLAEKLVTEKLEKLISTDEGNIIQLIGMLKQVKFTELNVLGYELKQDSKLRGLVHEINPSSSKVLSFVHQLYDEYWDLYFENTLFHHSENYKKIKTLLEKHIGQENITLWINDFLQLFNARKSAGIEESEANITMEDFTHLDYIELKEIFSSKIYSKSGKKGFTGEIILKNVMKYFGSQQELFNYLTIKSIAEKGYKTYKDIDLDKSIRFAFYIHLLSQKEQTFIENCFHKYFEKQNILKNIHSSTYHENTQWICNIVIPLLNNKFGYQQYWMCYAAHSAAEAVFVRGNRKKTIYYNNLGIELHKSICKDSLPEAEQDFNILGHLHNQYGGVLHSFGKKEQTIQSYKNAIECFKKDYFHTKNEKSLSLLGLLNLKLGEVYSTVGLNLEAEAAYRKAIKVISSSIEQSDDNGANYSNLSVCYQMLAEICEDEKQKREFLSQALSTSRSATTINNTNGSYFINYANAYLLMGDYLSNTFGTCEEVTDNYFTARKIHEKAIDLFPNQYHHHFYSNLGLTYIAIALYYMKTKTNNPIKPLDDAIDLFKQAIRFNSEDSRLFNTFANICALKEFYYGFDNISYIENLYQKAIKLNPNQYYQYLNRCVFKMSFALRKEKTNFVDLLDFVGKDISMASKMYRNKYDSIQHAIEKLKFELFDRKKEERWELYRKRVKFCIDTLEIYDEKLSYFAPVTKYKIHHL